jgi:hypothetical protein
MNECEQCPKLIDCHKESTGDLQLISDLVREMNRGFTMMAFETAERLQRRIQLRHNKLTGRA